MENPHALAAHFEQRANEEQGVDRPTPWGAWGERLFRPHREQEDLSPFPLSALTERLTVVRSQNRLALKTHGIGPCTHCNSEPYSLCGPGLLKPSEGIFVRLRGKGSSCWRTIREVGAMSGHDALYNLNLHNAFEGSRFLSRRHRSDELSSS